MLTIWNDERECGFNAREMTALPLGIGGIRCPKCGGDSVTGALIIWDDGRLVIESTDGQDPNLLCTKCGFWWDEYKDKENR